MLGKLTLIIVALCFYSSSAMADTAPAAASTTSAHKNLQVQPGSKKNSKHVTKKQHRGFCHPTAGERIKCE